MHSLKVIKEVTDDMDCFIPLMEKFREMYGFYPKYPVADAGYGSYNNYLYCEEHDMEKYMKFTMYEKTVKNADYRADSFKKIIIVEKSMKPRRDEKGYVTMGVKEFLLDKNSLEGKAPRKYGEMVRIHPPPPYKKSRHGSMSIVGVEHKKET